MKRLTMIGTLGMTLLAGGLVAAQTPAKPDDHAAHHPAAAAADKPGAKATPGGKPGAGEMGKGGMMGEEHGKGKGKGKGMMGKGMEGGGMQMCSMMEGNAKIEVTKLPKGVTITMTADDPTMVTRLQKRAEAMKLMHEANAHQ